VDKALERGAGPAHVHLGFGRPVVDVLVYLCRVGSEEGTASFSRHEAFGEGARRIVLVPIPGRGNGQALRGLQSQRMNVGQEYQKSRSRQLDRLSNRISAEDRDRVERVLQERVPCPRRLQYARWHSEGVRLLGSDRVTPPPSRIGRADSWSALASAATAANVVA
jgi:hypothetical protein